MNLSGKQRAMAETYYRLQYRRLQRKQSLLKILWPEYDRFLERHGSRLRLLLQPYKLKEFMEQSESGTARTYLLLARAAAGKRLKVFMKNSKQTNNKESSAISPKNKQLN